MVFDTKLYELLEVPYDCDETALKRAYHTMAKKHHPDKGGSDQQFKDINAAYKILSDPQMRRMYDETGSVDSRNLEVDSTLDDLFKSAFSGMFSQFTNSGVRKRTQDSVQEIFVPLEHMFSGKNKKLSINRNKLCKGCCGHGGRNVTRCVTCNGTGIVVQQVQHGFMIMQNQSQCSACSATGKFVHPENRCEACSGKGVKREKTIVELEIPRGVPNGYTVTFKGMADEKLDHDTGNMIFVIRQEPHDTFVRMGDDLSVIHKINLGIALVGGTIEIPHIKQGEALNIKLKKGKVIVPNQIMTIDGEGMPKFGDKNEFGNMVIKFDIVFPSDDWARQADRKSVKTMLREQKEN